MVIRFQFEPETAGHAAAYLLRAIGGVSDKIRLMKLLYYADRDHFLAFGYPITGDYQYALPHGPAGTCSLNLLNGVFDCGESGTDQLIEPIGKQFRLVRNPLSERLAASHIEVMGKVLSQHGTKDTARLWKETHALPEYLECESKGSSAPIPYEVILKHHGGPKGYRHGRPVITQEMARHMVCPFNESEPDTQ